VVAEVTASVDDLAVSHAASRSLTVSRTQVDDGTGSPARYRVKYSSPAMGPHRTATVACKEVVGTAIGEPISCTLWGLEPSSSYQIQLAAYKVVDGAWTGTTFSNVASGTTTAFSGAVDDLQVRNQLP
jgi:hypothetical protein